MWDSFELYIRICVSVWHMYQRKEGGREERDPERERKKETVVTGPGRDLVSFTFPLPESEVNSFILQNK